MQFDTWKGIWSQEIRKVKGLERDKGVKRRQGRQEASRESRGVKGVKRIQTGPANQGDVADQGVQLVRGFPVSVLEVEKMPFCTW